MVAALKQDGTTVVVSSHLLDLVQDICDRVALFNRGKIGLIGRVGDLMMNVPFAADRVISGRKK